MNVSLFTPILQGSNSKENLGALRWTTRLFNFGQTCYRIHSSYSSGKNIYLEVEDRFKPSWFGIAVRVAAILTLIIPLLIIASAMIYRSVNKFTTIKPIDQMSVDKPEEPFATLVSVKKTKIDICKSFDNIIPIIEIVKPEEPFATLVSVKGSELDIYKSLDNKIPYKELIRQEKIGEGMFGNVWKGKWTQMDAPVAIKIPDRPFGNHLESELNDSLKALHPNIIITYGISEKKSIIMELMDTALSDYITELKKNGLILNRKIVNRIAKGVVDGLSYLHSLRIAHKCVKSKNILLRFLPEGEIDVKISSLGLNNIILDITTVAENGTALKETTVRYRPPESFKRGYKFDDFEVTQFADIYGYGMMLWEMFAMRVPFSGHSEQGVVRLIGNEQRETLPDACPKLYEILINKCWKIVSKRPKSFEVSDELQEMFDVEEKCGLVPYVCADTRMRDIFSVIQKHLLQGHLYKFYEDSI